MISHRFCFRVLVAVVALLPIWLAAAPRISTQPGVVTATSATAATFNITASGTGTVRYQWRHLGVPIHGAVKSSCTLPAVKMADAGFYDVIVGDDTGETVSQAGQLLVSPVGGYPNTLRLDTGYTPLFETPWATVEAVAVAPSGDVYAGGVFSTIAGQRRYGLAKFNSTLVLDPTFAPVLDGDVFAVLAQADGRVIVGGYFSTVNGVAQKRIARFNADGTLDTTFTSGFGDAAGVWALALHRDGKILVGGWFSTVGGVQRPMVTRLNADGTLDASFGSTVGPDSTVNSIAVQQDGKVLIGGQFSQVDGISRSYLARLNADGSLDASFAVGNGFNDRVESLALQTDGKVVVGGVFTSYNGTARNLIARIDSNGALDPSLVTGTGVGGEVRAVAVLSDGRIAVSGLFRASNGFTEEILNVLTSTGARDPAFAPALPPNRLAYAIAPLPGGGFLTGLFNSLGFAECGGLVSCSATGAIEHSAVTGFRQPGHVLTVVPVADGKWIVGGSFSFLSGTACGNIARLRADGSLDATFTTGTGFDSQVYCLTVQGDGRIVAGGMFYTFNGALRPGIARLNADGSLDTGFDPGSGFSGSVRALILQADGKIVARGWFGSFNGTPRPGIARLNLDGSLDPAFDPVIGFASEPEALAIDREGRLIVSKSGRIARFKADGNIDTTFHPGTGFELYSTVRELVLTSEGKLMTGGSFYSYNGTSRSMIARLNSDGSLDAAFNPGTGFNGSALGLTLQADGRLVVCGPFTTYDGTARKFLARLQADGSLDSAFVADDLTSYSESAAEYTDDGRLLVVGGSANRGRVTQSGLVMLTPAPVITAQPIHQKANVGDSVTFSVSASGDDLRYQWSKDGATMAGATGRTLNIPSAAIRDVGGYSVRVWNNYASVISEAVTLSGLAPAPSIMSQPGAVTAVSGTHATFTVGATGTGPLTYQWRHLGLPIAGATSASLTLPAVAMADAGFYDVIVYNGLTPSTSQAGRLVVKPAGGYADTLRLDSAFDPFVEVDWAEVSSVAVAPSGAVYAVGSFTTIAGQWRNRVAKFNAALELDATFAPVVDGTVSVVLAEADGGVYIGGSFTAVNGVACSGLARLKPDGTLDFGFVPAVVAGPWQVRSLARQSGGRVLVGGDLRSVATGGWVALARLESNGALDPTFATDTGINGTVTSILVQTGGRILVGGSFSTVGGQSSNGLARLNADGTLDSSFTVGTGFDGREVGAIALQPDGRILVGGQFTSYNGVPANRLVRLGTDGAIDPSFTIGAGFDGEVRAVARLADGRIAVSGWFNSVNNTNQYSIAVLASDGTLDTGFATGARPNGPGYALISMADGGLLEGGNFIAIGSSSTSGLVRLSNAGTVLAATAAGFRRPGQVQAVVSASGGKWVIGGDFSAIDGVACSNLARLNADGTVDPTFASANGPNGSVAVLAVQGDGKVLAGGWFYWSHGVPRRSIARYNTDGSLDASFDPGTGFNSGVTTLALQADGKAVAGGDFTTFNGVTSNRIARLNAVGLLDTTFASGTGLDSPPRAVVVEPNGRIVVGGQFTSFDGAPVNYMVGLLPTGVRDSSFASGSGFSDGVVQLALRSDDTMMAAGYFSSYNGISCGAVAHLLEDGSSDSSFSLGGVPNVIPLRALLPQADGRTVVAGYFTAFSGVTKLYLTRLQANGALDASFGAFDLTAGVTGDSRFMDDGGLLLINSSAERGGVSRSGLLRLKPDVSPVAAITVQPVSQKANAGEAVTFSVTASGDDLHYQWSKDGVALAGATGGTLNIPSAGAGNVGSYSVRVWNNYATVTSKVVTLSGWAPAPAPSITAQPGVVTAVSGTNATFTVGATGTGPLTYQWRHLGIPIAGATSASLILPAVAMADAGFYDVIVYSGLTPATSQAGRLLVSPVGGYPNTMRLDTSFAPLFETRWAWVEDLSIAPSGAVYAGGTFSTIAGQRRYGLAKFSSALVLDPAFVPVLDGVVYAVLAQADGRVIVGGSFTTIDGVKQGRIARFYADGSLDTTFTSGFGDDGTVHALALCGDGKILVGGWFFSVDGIQRPMVARLNADGTLDATFGSAAGPSGTVNAIVVQPDGKVLIGGEFNRVDGESRFYFARLNADGSLDTSFAVGSGFDSPVTSLALQIDGKVVVGGIFTSYNGAICSRIARIDATGALDPSLVTGAGFDSYVNSVAVLSDGRIAVSGFFDAYNGTSQQSLSVLTSTGALDGAFAPTVLLSGPSYAIAALPGGRFLTGCYNWFGAAEGRSLVSYAATGAIEHAAATGFRTLGGVFAAVPVAAGKWVMGGDFAFLNGTPCGNIARLNADGSLDSAFMTGSGFDLPVNGLAVQGDGRIVAGGRFNAFNGTLRPRITRLNADGSLDTNFDPTGGPNSPVESLVLQTDGRIVARGWFDAFNGTPCRQIARLNFDGSLDTSFALGSGFDYAVVALAAERDGRTVAGGYFTSFAGTPRNRIVRLKWDGSLDTTFDPGTGFDSNWVRALMSMSNGRIVAAGDFSGFNGTSRSKIARLNSDGSLDTSFDPGLGFNESVYGLAPQTDGRFVASGFFSSYNGTARNYLARIQPDGALDPAFIAYDLTSRVESTPQYADDGRLLVAGGRANRGRVMQSGLVMLKPDVSPVAAITAQPLSQKANPGDSVTFSVTASGDALHYQWSKDGVALAGATKRTLNIPSAGVSNLGSYSVRVWNSYSSVISNAVTLSGLALAPSITTHPGVVTAVSGTNATFMVGATGTGPFSYQWRHLGIPIAGATSASLILPAVAMADAGFYDVIVYNGLTPATSQPGRLMVSPAGGYPNTLRLDTSFAPVFGQPMVFAVVPVAGGKWVVAGQLETVNGVPCSNIARLNADGTLDPSFAPGIGFNWSVRSLAVQGDGRIVAGGWFFAFNGTPRPNIARLNADGSLDTTFDPGSGFNGMVSSVILQADGRIVAQGMFDSFNGIPRAQIARLNVDGSLDTTFDPGSGFNSDVMALAVDDDGQLVAGGYFSSFAGTSRNRIARLKMDGSIDTAFDPGIGFGGMTALALMPTTEGRTVVGGWFSGFNGTARNNIARLKSDGKLDTTFQPGTGFDGPVMGITPQTDGGLLASGYFTSYNGAARSYLARLQSDGSLDPSFIAYDLTSAVQAGAQFTDDGRLLLLGTSATRGGTSQTGLVMLKADIDPTPMFSSWIAAQTDVPANQRGALDTPAGDGVNNLLKYALGVLPMESARASLPTLAIVYGPAGNATLVLRFVRNPNVRDIRLTLEVSSDLIQWNEVPATMTLIDRLPGGSELVQLQEINAPANSPRRFARLKVMVTP